MDVLRAHELFAEAKQAGELADKFEFEGEIALRGIGECTPSALTAACLLSGGLDDACNDADLLDCLRHFFSLLSAEIVDVESWTEETRRCIDALLAWGQEIDSAVLASDPAPWN